MRSILPQLSFTRAALLVLSVAIVACLFRPGKVEAQRSVPSNLAQVGPGAPLPVYMVNDLEPRLPEGFVTGSTWKFTQWTTPSALTFTATVQKTEGGWALLALSGNSAPPQWYFIPHMPGGWQLQ